MLGAILPTAIIIHRAQRELAAFTYAHILRYHGHVGSTYCHRPCHEHDQRVIGDFSLERSSERSDSSGLLSYAG